MFFIKIFNFQCPTKVRPAGLEPTAYRLKAGYSTIELRTHINFLSHLSQSDFIRLQLLSLSYTYIITKIF